MRFFSINGEQVSTISIADRSTNYGDGFFTTALIVDGIIQYEQFHLDRLVVTAEALGFDNFDADKVLNDVKLAAQPHASGVIKVLVTAGQGGRGYSRVGASLPNIIISIHDFPVHYNIWREQGIELGISSIKLGINPMLAGLKHNNRLEQVLIRKDLDSKAEDDVLVMDINNQVVETSSANLVYLSSGQWFTPTLDNAGVNGVMRQVLMSKGLVQEKVTVLEDITNADAIGICNSILGLAPVRLFNFSEFSIAPVKSLVQAVL